MFKDYITLLNERFKRMGPDFRTPSESEFHRACEYIREDFQKELEDNGYKFEAGFISKK